RVLVPGRGLLLPLPDGSAPMVGPPLVLHDGGFHEAPGDGLGAIPVGGEIGGNGSWQIECHRSSLRVRKTGALAPCVSWTPEETDRDSSAPGFFSSGAAPRARPRAAASAEARRPGPRAGETGGRGRGPRAVVRRRLRPREPLPVRRPGRARRAGG